MRRFQETAVKPDFNPKNRGFTLSHSHQSRLLKDNFEEKNIAAAVLETELVIGGGRTVLPSETSETKQKPQACLGCQQPNRSPLAPFVTAKSVLVISTQIKNHCK